MLFWGNPLALSEITQVSRFQRAKKAHGVARIPAFLQRLREPREAGGVALDLLDAGGAREPPVAVHDEGDVPRDGAAPQRPADRFW